MKINNTFLITKSYSFFSILLSLTCKIIVSLLGLHCATFLLSFWEFSHCLLLDPFKLLPILDSQRPPQEKVPFGNSSMLISDDSQLIISSPHEPPWPPLHLLFCSHRQQLLDATKTLKFDIKNNNRKITNFFLINRIHCMQSLAHD